MSSSSASSSYSSSLYAVPLTRRPPPDARDWLQTVVFNFFFGLAMIAIHTLQIVNLLIFHVHPATRSIYNSLVDWHKDLYGRVLVVITSIWAPTVLRITVDPDDDELDLRKIVHRDENGVVIGLDLPERAIMMANHQVYCDWSYIWNLLYFAQLQSSIIIILKASLKWAPLVGPAMQMFRFIFMQRNWSADKVSLGKMLAKFGDQANRSFRPFMLLIFPEGTLVSPQTRPISAKFAEKSGIKDGVHTLLPRSTGLLFCLRTLAPRVNTLRLVDVTIAYPGIPRGGYGQDYYTLQSIFSRGIPPPVIHMHIRSDSVKHSVPIGVASLTKSHTTGAEATEEEKKEFEAWLLERFRRKDEEMELFLNEGKLVEGPFVDIPVTLRNYRELAGLLGSCILGLWLAKWVAIVVWGMLPF